MKLHLHFWDIGPKGRPKLLMAQFWPNEVTPAPHSVTFNSFKTDSNATACKGKPDALCQLVLQGRPIEGALAQSLYHLARKTDDAGNSNWLQILFGLERVSALPTSIIEYTPDRCALGVDLAAATIECFLHFSPTKVFEAYRRTQPSRARGHSDSVVSVGPKPLTPEEMRRLGNRMLGNLTITSLDVQVMKNRVGRWLDSKDPGVLPLTSQDIFQLQIETSLEAHFYVFWIGSSGRSIVPVFPWLPSEDRRWKDTSFAERDKPRRTLVLAHDYASDLPEARRQFRSIGAAGAETLVVLANMCRLDAETMQAHLGTVPAHIKGPIACRKEDGCEVLELETGLPAVAADFDMVPEPRDDALGRVAAWLNRLPIWIDDAKALIVPSLGGE